MRAALRDRYGPPEVVEVREIDRPEPSGDDVLVRVRAASVNRADLDGLYPRWAFTRAFTGVRAPRVRRVGLDVAGVVEAVGPDTSAFRPGDEVFGDMSSFGQGAFAEYVCAPSRAFATMPPGTTFEEAATLPHSAVLALQGLRLRNGRSFEPGDRVLIVGASGNVGPFAVQIAKSRGAVVTGVSRGDKMDLVRDLGADHVIDYTKVDYTKAAERYAWILDVDGHHSVFKVRRALEPKGVYITTGGSTARIFEGMLGPLFAKATGKWMGTMLWWKPFHPDDVDTVKALLAAGTLRPVIDRRFPLSEVVEALRYVDDGHARGKVVVTI